MVRVMRTDTERLDWLGENLRSLILMDHPGRWRWYMNYYTGTHENGETIREAIDKAIGEHAPNA